MFLRELTASIDHVRGAGPAALRSLAQAGVTGVGGLLSRFPRDWEDRSRQILLKDFGGKELVCTVVTVLAHDWLWFGKSKALKVYVEDSSARASLVCFNRNFLGKQLVAGKQYFLTGHFSHKYGEIQSSRFEFEPLAENAPPGWWPEGGSGKNSAFGRILPVYSLSGELNQGMLRRLIRQALDQYAAPLEDELPKSVIAKEGLLSKSRALRAIHFPDSIDELNLAKKTLIYEELFYLEFMVGRRALERRNSPRPRQGAPMAAGPAAVSVSADAAPAAYGPLQGRLIERLPFRLTRGQEAAVSDINRDMEGGYPMARLLQGDVGSGKTLVSFLALLKAVEVGGQGALMAPTELLARQHAESAARLLEPLGIHVAFLTSNIKAAGRAQLLKALLAGEIDVVVGTHALFSRDVIYKNLCLVVVDEQHRFGVTQRSAIMAKGDRPDLLMMSATPIPRTLALTVFGDLDVSVISELPPGRKPVKTHLASESNSKKVYDFVRKELEEGRQAYFVYPLIEADEDRSLKDAQGMAKRLGQVFRGHRAAIVHSKLEEEEKRATMEQFRQGEIAVLVATSVVEVGVDVPNASCMVVEHAERFGLSALHQLRGRVGRGDRQAYCFLVFSASRNGSDADGLTEEGKARLKIMLESSDGFVIAEEDLKIRGPGQITGTEQSGYLALGISDPVRDAGILAAARDAAFVILRDDPSCSAPENAVISELLKRAPPFSGVVL